MRHPKTATRGLAGKGIPLWRLHFHTLTARPFSELHTRFGARDGSHGEGAILYFETSCLKEGFRALAERSLSIRLSGLLGEGHGRLRRKLRVRVNGG